MDFLFCTSYHFTLQKEEKSLLEIEGLKSFTLSNEMQSIDNSPIPENLEVIFDKNDS